MSACETSMRAEESARRIRNAKRGFAKTAAAFIAVRTMLVPREKHACLAYAKTRDRATARRIARAGTSALTEFVKHALRVKQAAIAAIRRRTAAADAAVNRASLCMAANA